MPHLFIKFSPFQVRISKYELNTIINSLNELDWTECLLHACGKIMSLTVLK